MTIDDELELMEDSGETDLEAVDQESELDDYQNDLDEILGDEADESDLERAYESFSTPNEADYNGYDGMESGGWDHTGVDEEAEDAALGVEDYGADGYEVEDKNALEAEVIEMEIEDGDVQAYIVDENDNEIGFILLDEDGNEVEYYYVDDEFDDESEELVSVDGKVVTQEGERGTRVMRASDEEEFDLGITREGVAEATADMNAIYREGSAVVSELKEAFDDINEGLGFLKKK